MGRYKSVAIKRKASDHYHRDGMLSLATTRLFREKSITELT